MSLWITINLEMVGNISFMNNQSILELKGPLGITSSSVYRLWMLQEKEMPITL
jgi:hypothetical protein